MGYDEILFAANGAVGTITLNNPGRINALSRKMIAELTDLLDRAAGDEALKVIILRAAGAHFCAGHDLKEMVGRGMRENAEIFDRCSRMMQRLHEVPQPVIAQVQGIATAAGCQLAAWCDLVVAEEGARFATPGVKIGLFCTTPMTAITRAIGRKAAMEMLLTGRYYSAAEAKGLGLVNRVVPLARLSADGRKGSLRRKEHHRPEPPRRGRAGGHPGLHREAGAARLEKPLKPQPGSPAKKARSCCRSRSAR